MGASLNIQHYICSTKLFVNLQNCRDFGKAKNHIFFILNNLKIGMLIALHVAWN